MTTTPSKIPAIPAELTGEALVAAVNDRLRRAPSAAAAAAGATQASTTVTVPGVPSPPGTPAPPVTGTGAAARIVGLAIANLTAGNSATIAVTPTLAGATASLNLTYWYSLNGGRQVYWIDWQPYYPGTTTALDFAIAAATNAQAGGLT